MLLYVDQYIISLFTRPIAVAVFEYDTLGDEKSLAFDEGDIIEVRDF